MRTLISALLALSMMTGTAVADGRGHAKKPTVVKKQSVATKAKITPQRQPSAAITTERGVRIWRPVVKATAVGPVVPGNPTPADDSDDVEASSQLGGYLIGPYRRGGFNGRFAGGDGKVLLRRSKFGPNIYSAIRPKPIGAVARSKRVIININVPVGGRGGGSRAVLASRGGPFGGQFRQAIGPGGNGAGNRNAHPTKARPTFGLGVAGARSPGLRSTGLRGTFGRAGGGRGIR